MALGDFNDMISIADKKGNNSHPQALLDGFKQTIDVCGLIELDLMGGNFTWEKSRGTRDWDGDSNSKYFHAYATSRRKKNQVTYLKNENGEVVSKHEDMCEIVKSYFTKIFGDERIQRGNMEVPEAVITKDQNRKLIAEFTMEEFSVAIKQMHPNKSAGPDGLNPAFYQHFWNLFGSDKENAYEMKDLRPIALCNVLYKVISNVLANRLKVILLGIITDNQSTFVRGRNITDNLLLAFELLHYMKQKKKGVEGEVALKFIGPINPARRLRQGDPLSPYLFLFCVEGLSRMLKNAADEVEEVMEVKSILHRYELHSGQAINLHKSGIYFSSNVRLDKQEELKNLVGVYSDLNTGKYLGLPSLIGRSKKMVFNFFKDRLWSKIQGWSSKCLLKAGKNNPDSLVVKVFKARYFPASSLFEVGRRGGITFVWSGLWQAKEYLKQGFRWVVWDGRSIKVSSDAWLRGKDEYRIDEQYRQLVSDLKVYDLFLPVSSEWDVTKQYFSNCKQLEESKRWGRLWQIQIPQKVKMFLWRVCQNYVPVHILLRGKGVNTPILCPLCGVDVEHSRHIYLECSYAEGCWNELGLGFDMSRILSCSEWLLNTLAVKSYEKLAQIATVLWGIWAARNMKVWQNKTLMTQMAMQWSVLQVKQWHDSQQLKLYRNKDVVQINKEPGIKWQPLDEGRMKINVDAHVVAGNSWFSCGLVLRDHEGKFIVARTHKFAGEVPVVEAEAIVVLEATRWMSLLGL
ncbi:uncharacterized protein LOC141695759 [Apium graveolens]|uniref:uncharacterized protein LOC141695759 n=1 Tax=Apium graveolens TaxID=4045 RepID=UPI003D79743F